MATVSYSYAPFRPESAYFYQPNGGSLNETGPELTLLPSGNVLLSYYNSQFLRLEAIDIVTGAVVAATPVDLEGFGATGDWVSTSLSNGRTFIAGLRNNELFVSPGGVFDYPADPPPGASFYLEYGPQVAGLVGDRAVVSYQILRDGQGASNVNANVGFTIYNNTGGLIRDNTLVPGASNVSEIDPSIAPLTSGGFVLAWTSRTYANGAYGPDSIRAARYDSDGNLVGEVIIDEVGNNTESKVIGLADGGFAVVYADTQFGVADISLRLFNANGTARTEPIRVNGPGTFAGIDVEPTVTQHSNGMLTVSWSHEVSSSNLDLYMRSFSLTGEPLTAEMRYQGTDLDAFYTSESSIVGTGDGLVMSAWRDSEILADGGSHIGSMVHALQRTTLGDMSNETLNGDQLQDLIEGSGGNDRIFAYGGADTLTGGDGNDILDGGTGADKFFGGAGNDTFYVDLNADAVREAVGEGVDTVLATGTFWLHASAEIEILRFADLAGTQAYDLRGNDFVQTITGNAGHNDILGLGGNDVLLGGGGRDNLIGGLGEDYLYGGIGDDRAQGEDGNDRLFGEAGVDTLSGGGGVDQIQGGADNDTINGDGDDDYLYGDDGNDVISGGTGSDKAYGGIGNDAINGGDGIDVLQGQAGVDTLYGDADADYLYGGDDADFLYGGAGVDVIDGGTGNDTVYGGDDGDVVYGQTGVDVVHGEGGNDYVYGGDDADYLYGEAGVDVLLGQLGDDRLYGGTETDYLYGGDGIDQLFGEAGNDTLRGEAGADYLDGGLGVDIMFGGAGDERFLIASHSGYKYLQDFVAGGTEDRIQLSGSGLTTFAQLKPFMSQAGADVVIALHADTTIRLTGVTLGNLTAGDFVFV